MYVCLYKEIEAAVNTASLRAKQILQDLHPSILVRYCSTVVCLYFVIWIKSTIFQSNKQNVSNHGPAHLIMHRWFSMVWLSPGNFKVLEVYSIVLVNITLL